MWIIPRNMKRAQAIIGSAIFLVLAPGIVAVAVPWWISGWRMSEPLLGFVGFRLIGALLIACGLPVLLDSFARFAFEGLGTPAPVAPTEHLVTTGLYRYVRNPMYMAVSLLIFGQGVFLANRAVLRYGVAVCIGFAAFVWFYEEPTLRRTFGSEYEEFCANVPRWIPRRRTGRRRHDSTENRRRDSGAT
jgi:protein-S-isoprenylcysteine O-methyltransferase Ste14